MSSGCRHVFSPPFGSLPWVSEAFNADHPFHRTQQGAALDRGPVFDLILVLNETTFLTRFTRAAKMSAAASLGFASDRSTRAEVHSSTEGHTQWNGFLTSSYNMSLQDGHYYIMHVCMTHVVYQHSRCIDSEPDDACTCFVNSYSKRDRLPRYKCHSHLPAAVRKGFPKPFGAKVLLSGTFWLST